MQPMRWSPTFEYLTPREQKHVAWLERRLEQLDDERSYRMKERMGLYRRAQMRAKRAALRYPVAG